MQMLMFESSGKDEAKTKPAGVPRAKKDAPIDPPTRATGAANERGNRPHGMEEEADRWDGLY